jgi:hypothetical protein
MTKNPFIYGKILKDDDFICPRPKDEKRFLSNVDSAQNTCVIGERRVGKSTFIYSTLKKYLKKESKLLISVDFRSVASKEDVQKRLMMAILRAAKELKDWSWFMGLFKSIKPVISPKENGEFEFSLGAGDAQSYNNLSLEEIFDFLEKINQRKKVVVVFDEFQDILALDLGVGILGEMRAKIQLEADIAYVFAGSVRGKMNEIFSNPNSSFYKSADPLFLDRFNENLLALFCVDLFQSGKRNLSIELFSDIFRVCHGITGDVLKLCHEIWEETEEGSFVTPDTLTLALNLIAERDSSNYQSQVSLLTNLPKKTLRAIVLDEKKEYYSQEFISTYGLKSKASVMDSLNTLYRNQILYKLNGRIEFYDPFLKYWLKTTYRQ